jgi:hypothetical protein
MANTTSAVIFDTGASLGITHDIQDFDGPLTIPDCDLRLGGMANGLKIEGIGPVTWTFSNKDGTEVQIRSQCNYVRQCNYVPQSKMRLISPQSLFNKEKGVNGWYKGDEESFRLQFDGCPCLIVEYDPRNHLPIGQARIGGSGMLPQVNFALTNEGNQNISAGQKLLLNWHFRFRHLNLPAVQRILRGFPFTANRFASASKFNAFEDLKCEICQYSKGHRCPTHSSTIIANPERTGALKAEQHLGPGVRVSVDHFESRLSGRTIDSYGKPSAETYKGGCIFVDHGTGYIQTVSPRWRQLEMMKTLLNTGMICVWKIQPTYRRIQTMKHPCIFKTNGSLQMNKHNNRGSCIDNSGFVPLFPHTLNYGSFTT